MEERKRFWKAGCIGPSMVLLGLAASVYSLTASITSSIVNMKPGQKPELSGHDAWSNIGIIGMDLIGAGLLVMLFQGILWLVRRSGVAQTKKSNK